MSHLLSLIVPVLLLLTFAVGSGLFWLPYVKRLRIHRMSRLAILAQKIKHLRHASHVVENPHGEPLSLRERQYGERARLCGFGKTWSYRNFQVLQASAAIAAALLLSICTGMQHVEATASLSLRGFLWIMTQEGLALIIGWWLPAWVVIGLAGQARSRYLLEIAKLSERLALCVNEKTDTRDLLLRASRPLILLKPHILELAAMWGKNQQMAIWRFKEEVGISEVFPLVNALYAISRAEAKDVVKVLQEQTKSIDATLESDINRKIENAPVWISFYIMIPFACVVLLFLYPWLMTIQTQLLTGY